jgi:hypothetical protein
MDNAMQVGQKLVDLCREGQNVKAVETLYAPNIVSIEATPSPTHPQRMEGIDAVRGKNDWWVKNHDIHKSELKGPFPHGDRFIVYGWYDVTPKDGPMKGKRMQMDETALYTVKDGKIVKEEFFYHMG